MNPNGAVMKLSSRRDHEGTRFVMSLVGLAREALNTLEKRQQGLGELRQMIEEAEEDFAAGRVGPFDAAATKQVVRERLRDHGVSD